MSERNSNESAADRIFTGLSEFSKKHTPSRYQADEIDDLAIAIRDVITELFVNRLPDSAFDQANRLPENICAILPFGRTVGFECWTQEQVDFFTKNFGATVLTMKQVREKRAGKFPSGPVDPIYPEKIAEIKIEENIEKKIQILSKYLI